MPGSFPQLTTPAWAQMPPMSPGNYGPAGQARDSLGPLGSSGRPGLREGLKGLKRGWGGLLGEGPRGQGMGWRAAGGCPGRAQEGVLVRSHSEQAAHQTWIWKGLR